MTPYYQELYTTLVELLQFFMNLWQFIRDWFV
jgi:hypothetical protein